MSQQNKSNQSSYNRQDNSDTDEKNDTSKASHGNNRGRDMDLDLGADDEFGIEER